MPKPLHVLALENDYIASEAERELAQALDNYMYLHGYVNSDLLALSFGQGLLAEQDLEMAKRRLYRDSHLVANAGRNGKDEQDELATQIARALIQHHNVDAEGSVTLPKRFISKVKETACKEMRDLYLSHYGVGLYDPEKLEEFKQRSENQPTQDFKEFILLVREKLRPIQPTPARKRDNERWGKILDQAISEGYVRGEVHAKAAIARKLGSLPDDNPDKTAYLESKVGITAVFPPEPKPKMDSVVARMAYALRERRPTSRDGVAKPVAADKALCATR